MHPFSYRFEVIYSCSYIMKSGCERALSASSVNRT